jgi:hypothetical protein
MGGGGVIVSGGTPRAKLTLLQSIVTANTAQVGGGIYTAGNGAAAVIQDSLILSNTAQTSGGGIANSGDLNLLNSTLAQNQARSGGGIEHFGFSMKITNSTISGNSATDNGGGLTNRGDALILNATFSANTASGLDSGSNIFQDTGSLTIKNSIIAASHTDSNCFINEGSILSQGNNLESGNTCGFNQPTDRIQTDPLLAPLQNNGGFTLTHALLDHSPAIDAGNNSGCPSTDQRGLPRPVDGNLDGVAVCDSGAYEAQASSPTLTPSQPSPTTTFTPVPQPPTATVTSTPLAGVTATSTPASPTSTPPTPPPTIPCLTSGALLVLLALLFRRLSSHA